ncbi:hypothetical protein [Luteolibacter sp. LG18]|uniref:hypothetical protein n=1 Tax=Luteolibacter sp. LG18 TaxID=2819286 RepID=UPI002B27CDDF|nr:hypothetical protein llg_36640 [Luteolibacter sp. LG18]
MKKYLPVSGIAAVSIMIGLVQWFSLHHLHGEIARLEQDASTPGGISDRARSRSIGATSVATASADPEGDFRKFVLTGLTGPSKNIIAGKEDRFRTLLKQLDPDTLYQALVKLGKDPRFTGMEYMVLRYYQEIQPRGAVEVALKLPDQLPQNSNRQGMGYLFYLWSAKEPTAALEWVRAHESQLHPEARDGMFRDAYLRQMQNDSRQAFANILADERLVNNETGKEIGATMGNPQQVRACFQTMDCLSADPGKVSAIAQIRAGVVDMLVPLFEHQSFTVASGVIDECLTAEEKMAFYASCNHFKSIPDPVKWADWLVKFEPPPAADPTTATQHPLVTRLQAWAKEDPNTAGAWLDRMPGGPLKDQASAAYNEGLSRRAATSTAE